MKSECKRLTVCAAIIMTMTVALDAFGTARTTTNDGTDCVVMDCGAVVASAT